MRFFIVGIVIVLTITVILAIVFHQAIEGWLKYYRIGLSCYDKLTGEFNETLDRSVLASDGVSDIEAAGYRAGREKAYMSHLKAQARYNKFKGGSK